MAERSRKIESLGHLGIFAQPHQAVVTDFIDEVIGEADFYKVVPKMSALLAKNFAKNCGVLPRREWQAAVEAIHREGTEQTSSLKERAAFERPVIRLLKGWRYLKEGHSQEATEYLNESPEFRTDSNSHLEAARLYFAAGDLNSANRMINEASGQVHDIRQIAYDQLREQIDQAQLLQSASQKRSAPLSEKSGPSKPKRRRTAATKAPTNEFEHLKRDNEALKTELKKKKAELETAESDYQASEESYIEQFEALAEQYRSLESGKEALEAEIEALQQNLRDVKSSSEATYIEKLNVNASLEKEITDTKVQAQRLSDKEEQSSQYISQLEASLGEKEEKVATLEADILKGKNEIDYYDNELRDANSKLKKQVRSLAWRKKALEIQKNNNTKLKKKVDVLSQDNQQQLNELAVKEQDFQKQMADVRQTIASQVGRIGHVVEGCAVRTSEIETTSQRLQEKIDTFKKDVEILKQDREIEELQGSLMEQVSSLQQKLEESKQQLSSLKQQLQESKQQNIILQNYNAQMSPHVQSVIMALAERDQKIRELRELVAQKDEYIAVLDSIMPMESSPETAFTSIPQVDTADPSADPSADPDDQLLDFINWINDEES